MESHPFSRLSFYDQSGAIIPEPVEGCKCGIAIDVPKEFHSAISLQVGGYLLPVLTNGAVAYSEWPSGGPGSYELFLECAGIRERRTVTVMPRYFTGNDLSTVLHELTESLPFTIASQLNACGARLGKLPSQDAKSSVEAEYLKLRRAIEGTREQLGMLQILRILQQKCHQVLLPKAELRSVNKARRPDISRLPQAIAVPGNLVSSDRLYRIFDITVERSLDAYENRLVKAYVMALRSQLVRLQVNVKSMRSPPVVPSDVDALANEFRLACTRAAFLREVKNSSVTSIRVNMLLLKNPAYRAVLEGYLALNEQSSVTLEDAALNLPLNYFPYLYQRWASLKVLSAMLQVCAQFGYQCISHHWVKSYQKGIIIQAINDVRPAVQLRSATSGRMVSFLPWSSNAGGTGFAAQEPPTGAAIFIETQNQPSTVLLFEPKYWFDAQNAQSRPLRKDVDDIISVRQQAKESADKSDISYSAILFPGRRQQLGPEFEALQAHPSNGDGLQKNLCDVFSHFFAE